MKIYTKTGDKGLTSLFGGMRISKSAIRLHAYGTIDELNASLGIVLASDQLPEQTHSQLSIIQSSLFTVGADLATPIESNASTGRVSKEQVEELEKWIDAMEETLPPLTTFILPSGSPEGSQLHLARTICRRAERWMVELGTSEKLSEFVLPYINRLSDYLFVVARFVNKNLHVPEEVVRIERLRSQ